MLRGREEIIVERDAEREGRKKYRERKTEREEN